MFGTRDASQLQPLNAIFVGVMGRILQPGSPFTTDFVSSKPQGVCAKGRVLAIPMFQSECAVNSAGIAAQFKEVSLQSLSVNYHTTLHNSFIKHGIYCSSFL